MKKTALKWYCLCVFIGVVGCAQFPAMNQMFDGLKPNRADYDDGTDDVDEGWIKEAGVEARGDRPVEIDNDPFRVLMSPKARSIESNLGIQ